MDSTDVPAFQITGVKH